MHDLRKGLYKSLGRGKLCTDMHIPALQSFKSYHINETSPLRSRWVLGVAIGDRAL